MHQSMLKLLRPADAISLLNACFGFLAILSILLNEQRLSFSFIFLALLADGLDGIIARRFGGGKMGESLEAMADMVSLSIAPIFFGFMFALNLYPEVSIVFAASLTIGIFFLVCSAIRLASFHVFKNQYYFVGLPASVSTMMIMGISYFNISYFWYLLIIFLLSLAMISPLKFPKPGIQINIGAAILITIILIFYTNFNNILIILLILSMVFYSFIGSIYVTTHKTPQ